MLDLDPSFPLPIKQTFLEVVNYPHALEIFAMSMFTLYLE